MKKKIIILTTLLLAVFVGVQVANITSVNAEDSGYKIRVTTNIEKWSWSNDLVFRISETWNENNHLSKKVYLQGPINNITTRVEIPDLREGETSNETSISLGAYRSSTGSFTGDYFWKNSLIGTTSETTRFNFDEGSTVSLIEEYTISENFNPGVGTAVYDLFNNDYLTLDINNSTIINNSLEEYANDTFCSSDEKGKCNLKIYSDCTYDSSDISSDRNMICVFSLNRNEKVTNYNKGTIVLPTFNIGTDLNISGNAAPKGNFALHFKGLNEGTENDTYFYTIDNDPENRFSNYTIGQIINYENRNSNWINRSTNNYESTLVSSLYGSSSFDVIRNTNYSTLSYREAKNYYENVDVLYIPEGTTIDNPWDGEAFANGTYTINNESIGASDAARDDVEQPNYTRVFEGNANSDRNFDNDITLLEGSTNDYSVTLTYNETINRGAPTGIFYNLLPYIALLLLSLFVFIVFVIKQNEEEDNNK